MALGLGFPTRSPVGVWVLVMLGCGWHMGTRGVTKAWIPSLLAPPPPFCPLTSPSLSLVAQAPAASSRKFLSMLQDKQTHLSFPPLCQCPRALFSLLGSELQEDSSGHCPCEEAQVLVSHITWQGGYG